MPTSESFRSMTMALMAAVLLYMGAGQISALQQFIVITAIPVSLILLPSLYIGPKSAYAMAREQGIVPPKGEVALVGATTGSPEKSGE